MFKFLKRDVRCDKVSNYKDQNEDFKDASALFLYFKQLTGIDFSKKEALITTKLMNFCKDRGFYTFESFLDNVRKDHYLQQELVDYLTINETYFYREFYQVEMLIQMIKKRDDKIRILCMPASSGEEPYSIAMALLEAWIPKEKFEIVGVDINAEVISRAKEAIYTSRSLYKVPSNVQEIYFRQQGTYFHLSDVVKKLVKFEVVNLFDDALFGLGKFDYIFCRNMMIYFDQETKLEAQKRVESILRDQHGRVFWGHADRLESVKKS
ncbi:MAG: protein-glutamate O-methyltransferase CheR [Epsilonproteobacteria bacterium]|nr:protein-glutamate O-methyltransferase CheR [Campylobacterota bacterium]